MLTEPVKAWEPISESNRERVFKMNTIPVFYRVEVTCPDSTVKVLENVRAYTKSLLIDDDTGRIDLEIASDNKSGSVHRTKIGYPYHYLHQGNVLCVLKRYGMRCNSDERVTGFALNYNLFNLSWQLCLILHRVGDEILAFLATRAEWDRGTIGNENCEVQMFLKVPNERSVPIGFMQYFVDPSISLWISHCETELAKK